MKKYTGFPVFQAYSPRKRNAITIISNVLTAIAYEKVDFSFHYEGKSYSHLVEKEEFLKLLIEMNTSLSDVITDTVGRFYLTHVNELLLSPQFLREI